MKLHLFDATPDSDPIEEARENGALSPSHSANVTVDYEYQAELWVEEIGRFHSTIVRVECPSLGRKWIRDSGSTMTEAK